MRLCDQPEHLSLTSGHQRAVFTTIERGNPSISDLPSLDKAAIKQHVARSHKRAAQARKAVIARRARELR
eukprot:SAG31_NODE_33652_length_341_cov_0.942149_1_plen_69_part_01